MRPALFRHTHARARGRHTHVGTVHRPYARCICPSLVHTLQTCSTVTPSRARPERGCTWGPRHGHACNVRAHRGGGGRCRGCRCAPAPRSPGRRGRCPPRGPTWPCTRGSGCRSAGSSWPHRMSLCRSRRSGAASGPPHCPGSPPGQWREGG